MELGEEFLSIKYTLRLKREVDTTLFSTRSEYRNPSLSKLESYQDSLSNVQQQKSAQQSQSEVRTETLSSNTPSTFTTSSTVSSFPESISSSNYEGSNGDVCAQLLKQTDEFIKCIEKKYGTSNYSSTFTTSKRCLTRKAESIIGTSLPETVEKQTAARKTNSKNRQERDDKVWSSGTDSWPPSSEKNESNLAENLNESSSDTSTPLDWMSPPSPNSQNLSTSKEILIREAAEENVANATQPQMQMAQRSCNKCNRHSRTRSYLSMDHEGSDGDDQKRFRSPVVEVMRTKGQSARASRNIQMRKFIARSTLTPQISLAKLKIDKQVGNARSGNSQISTPIRAESISTNRSLDMHIPQSSKITTANETSKDKRRNMSSKQQQTTKTNKDPVIIQDQPHAKQVHAAIEGALKTGVTQSVRYSNSEIPITERKVPIPKLERDMLQKSACLPTGSELTMSTQGTSTRGTSNKSFSSPNSTQKSSKRDEIGLHEPEKEQKNAPTTTPFSRTSSSSGQSSNIGGSSSMSFSSSMTTTSTSKFTSISDYVENL